MHWRTAWKVIECLGVVMVMAWLLYPYPYTWDQLGQQYPGAEHGVFIPFVIFLWLNLGYEAKDAKAVSQKSLDKDPSNGVS